MMSGKIDWHGAGVPEGAAVTMTGLISIIQRAAVEQGNTPPRFWELPPARMDELRSDLPGDLKSMSVCNLPVPIGESVHDVPIILPGGWPLPPSRPRFEYRTERYADRGRMVDLNALGADGWELVSTTLVSIGSGEVTMWFKRVAAVLLVAVLAGCGTYHLATDVRGPVGVQRQVDILDCREAAHEYSERAGAQVRGFATGFFLPVVGIAVDNEAIKRDRRDAFARCMTARGYSVVVGRD